MPHFNEHIKHILTAMTEGPGIILALHLPLLASRQENKILTMTIKF